MTEHLIYTPADPAGVTAVPRLRLYSTVARTDPPTIDTGPATRLADGSWDFAFPDPTPARYFSRITVEYADGLTIDDVDDEVVLPVPAPRQGAEDIAPWIPASELTGVGELAALTEAQRLQAVEAATGLLFRLSGRRWSGARIDRLRLSPDLVGVRVPLPSSTPWSAIMPRRLGACPCHAGDLDPQLPGPITRVVRLTVGGVDVPAEQIETPERRTIRVRRGTTTVDDPLAVNYWSDGEGYYSLFPGGSASCGRQATVELVVEWGSLPDTAGLLACRAVAVEIGKAFLGDESCRLAGNVVTVNRQGVAVLLDPKSYLDAGRTGVPEADVWLAAVNPRKHREEADVWWPESDAPVRLS